MSALFEKLALAVKNDIAVEVITLVQAPPEHRSFLGQMMLVFPDGQVEGRIIDEKTTAAVKEKMAKQECRPPALLEFPADGHRFFWSRSERKRRAVIAGGGHISFPLTEILSFAEFDVTVIDDRPEFANKFRFPRAQQVICDSFMRAFSTVNIDGNTAVIIVTRGHRYDIECLRAVLKSKARYIGMIGSRRRIQAIIDQLVEEGNDLALLDELRAPIGLDIGAQSPGEIAVSIAAEIIAVFRTGDCLPLSKKRR
jgi:xanthine dehydrogenase accessory factor